MTEAEKIKILANALETLADTYTMIAESEKNVKLRTAYEETARLCTDALKQAGQLQ